MPAASMTDGLKTTLETSGEDVKTTLKKSEEDVINTLKRSLFRLKPIS